MHSYTIIYEIRNATWFAHVPAVPGCVAQGQSREETQARIQELLHAHISSLRVAVP